LLSAGEGVKEECPLQVACCASEEATARGPVGGEAVAGQSGTTNFVEASGASEEAIARRPAVIGGRLSRAEQNHELSASPLGPLDAKHPARRQPYSTTKSSRVISLS